MFNHNTQIEQEVRTEKETLFSFSLVLYNDDVNTFDHVIDCLIKYCNHEAIQAEQCAWIVHTTGKCVVKKGDYNELESICTALCNQQLSASIELT